jgi:hypothetical protein
MLRLSVTETASVGAVITAGQAAVEPTFARSLLKAANLAGGVIQRRVVRDLPGGTGDLSGSFLPAKYVRSKTGGIAAGALSDLSYAGIHNRGGTIRSSRGGSAMLSVPLTQPAKTKWPRDWPKDDLALIPSKKAGTALLIGAKEKELVVHYVLKDEVTIDPTYYLDQAAEETKRQIPELFGQELRQNLSEQMRRAANA